MIVTVTPNPSVDRSVMIDALLPGEVHRATGSRVDPGGKGINVARAITAQGGHALAVMPTGGPEGHLLEELLDSAGVPRRSVPITGSARMNISVLEPDGTTTKLNEPGPVLDSQESAELLAAALDASVGAAWLVGCGSLPPGVPVDFYASLIIEGRAAGLRVAIDSSGPAMAAALSARPHLIKPNLEELSELAGRDLLTLGDVRDEARRLIDLGIETVAVSLGEDGALLVTGTTEVLAKATVAVPLSTVGAGDCMLAGLLYSLSDGNSPESSLETAVRWGSAAVALPGSGVPHQEDLVDIVVHVDTSPSPITPLGR